MAGPTAGLCSRQHVSYIDICSSIICPPDARETGRPSRREEFSRVSEGRRSTLFRKRKSDKGVLLAVSVESAALVIRMDFSTFSSMIFLRYGVLGAWACIGFLAGISSMDAAAMQPRDRTGVFSEMAGPADDDSASAFGITAFRYEIDAAMVGSMLALGADVRVDLYYPFSLGVRLSLDLDHGSLFTIPYLGVTWKGIGGFEVGRMFRPAVTTWTVPYWETWRGWIGDEKKFTLGASVLSSVPLNSVGYWDGGIGFALDDESNQLWLGVASIGPDRRAKGPACKVSLYAGEHTWVLLKASYMFSKGDSDIGTTFTAGLRQEF
jgi:hypothetical protein